MDRFKQLQNVTVKLLRYKNTPTIYAKWLVRTVEFFGKLVWVELLTFEAEVANYGKLTIN